MTKDNDAIRAGKDAITTGNDYAVQLEFDQPAAAVFAAINDVAKWWTDDLEGDSHQLNDAFTVHFEPAHVSTQKLVEFIPDIKVVWLVTYSKLTFVPKQDEWTNTEISFELTPQGGKTNLKFIHHGLAPAFQCYDGCSKGWDYFIKGSLYKLITEGKGTPGL